MAETIQSLSICCPSKTGKCINHCKTCTARQHANPYPDLYDGTRCQTLEYWANVIKRMRNAQTKGCTTVMLTGSNEPQQNRRWLEGLYLAMQSLPEPFTNIEIQTTGALLDEDYLRFLKLIGVTTVAVSTFNIFDDTTNRDIEESADKKLNLENLCKMITDLGMNLRLCINVTDYVTKDDHHIYIRRDIGSYSDKDAINDVNDILTRCSELGANQVTFRKMWSAPGTPEAEWINGHSLIADRILSAVTVVVKKHGHLINVLPYGAARYDYKGFSIVIDIDSMAKDEANMATKYYIIREDGKMYSSWDSPASIIF